MDCRNCGRETSGGMTHPSYKICYERAEEENNKLKLNIMELEEELRAAKTQEKQTDDRINQV